MQNVDILLIWTPLESYKARQTFFIWFLPKDNILSFTIPFKGIMRSIQFVDKASRLNDLNAVGHKLSCNEQRYKLNGEKTM